MPIEQLHLFPPQAGFEEFEGVLHAPTLPIHAEDADRDFRVFDRPIGQQQPRLLGRAQHPHLHQPDD